MKVLAAVLAAAVGLSLMGCVGDRAPEVVSAVAPEPKQVQTPGPVAQASPAVEESAAAAGSGADDAAVAVAAESADGSEGAREPSERTTDGSTSGTDNGVDKSGEPVVRDAKEATEAAARKILDATVGAAAKIRDVGRDAVQSVLESANRKDSEAEVDGDEAGEGLAAARLESETLESDTGTARE